MDIIVRVTDPNDAFRTVIHEDVSNFTVDTKGYLSVHRGSATPTAIYSPGGWLSAHERPSPIEEKPPEGLSKYELNQWHNERKKRIVIPTPS